MENQHCKPENTFQFNQTIFFKQSKKFISNKKLSKRNYINITKQSQIKQKLTSEH